MGCSGIIPCSVHRGCPGESHTPAKRNRFPPRRLQYPSQFIRSPDCPQSRHHVPEVDACNGDDTGRQEGWDHAQERGFQATSPALKREGLGQQAVRCSVRATRPCFRGRPQGQAWERTLCAGVAECLMTAPCTCACVLNWPIWGLELNWNGGPGSPGKPSKPARLLRESERPCLALTTQLTQEGVWTLFPDFFFFLEKAAA